MCLARSSRYLPGEKVKAGKCIGVPDYDLVADCDPPTAPCLISCRGCHYCTQPGQGPRYPVFPQGQDSCAALPWLQPSQRAGRLLARPGGVPGLLQSLKACLLELQEAGPGPGPKEELLQAWRGCVSLARVS